jgi:FixJ family two-component response regulator
MPDKTVFVVDDDAAVTQGLRFMLRAAAYSVKAFPSARSFLEDYDPRRGGCLLLDVRMPQMTGLELQQQLNLRGWRIPVIFITGHGTLRWRRSDEGWRLDFIEKPLCEDVLPKASSERCIGMTTHEERPAQCCARRPADTPRTSGLRADGRGRAQTKLSPAISASASHR